MSAAISAPTVSSGLASPKAKTSMSSAPTVHNPAELADPSSPLGAKMQDVVDDLLSEGFLRKIRGFGRNRNRWFRLTNTYFAFYTEDAGSLVAYVPRAAIVDVRDVSATRFSINTTVPFGASGQSHMVLEGRSAAVGLLDGVSTAMLGVANGYTVCFQQVKTRWLHALSIPPSTSEVPTSTTQTSPKYIEGFLTKLQMFGAMSRTRWFVLTDVGLSYATTDGGQILGECTMANIHAIVPRGEASFLFKAHAPFTKTGASTLHCQCSSAEVRDKWIDTLERVLGDARVKSEFAPLPQAPREATDRFAVLTKQEWEYSGSNSEGNRFIADNAL